MVAIDELAPGKVRIAAPAKLNLYLEILGKRDDGFHELVTVMSTVNLCDELRITRIDSGVRLACDTPGVPSDASNLAWRAAELAIERFGGGYAIELDKRIPSGAGLGGGSSDAAAVLRAADHLESRPHDPESWAAPAATLGSDVPFFLYGGTAVCRGRGERIEPVRNVPERHFVLVTSDIHCATGSVYAALDTALTPQDVDLSIVPEALLGGDHRHLAGAILNRLEEPALRTHPDLRRLRDDICEWSDRTVYVTGSGSGLFLVATDAVEANQLRSKLDSRLRSRGRVHALVTTRDV